MADNNSGSSELSAWVKSEFAGRPEAPANAQAYQRGAEVAAAGGADPFGKYFGTEQEPNANPFTENLGGVFTGANAYGTNNGWQTVFYEQMDKSYTDAQEKGRLADQFKAAKELQTTGVVMWDHNKDGSKAKGDGTDDFVFGDVYVQGEKKGNVYDEPEQGGGGRNYGDMLMSKIGVLTADEFKDTASRSDAQEALSGVIQEKREKLTQDIPKQYAALEQQEEFADQAESQGKGAAAATVAARSAGGAAVGAGIGSFVPVIGTAAGAIGGGVVGAVAGVLNLDEDQEMLARAVVVTRDARDQFNTAAAVGTGFKEFGGLASRTLMPVSAVSHGLLDVTAGEWGDNKSEAYAVDEVTGERKHGFMKYLDLGTGVADAALTFGSGAGVKAYQATMGTTIAGSVAQPVFTGGMTYDDRRGGFESMFKNEEGDVDLTESAAGIAAIGIDALQMGTAGAIRRQVTSNRAAAGMSGAEAPMLSRVAERIGLRKDPSVREEAMAGMLFRVDKATGKATGHRRTLALLAPSELSTYATVKALAARESRKRGGGVVTSDDLMRQAQRLQTSTPTMRAALLNGWGEGMEEAAQALLEPHSHGWGADRDEVFDSFMQGMAMGAGMTIGSRVQMSSQQYRDDQQIKMVLGDMNGGVVPTEAELRGMSDLERRSYLNLNPLDTATVDAAVKGLVREQRREQVASLQGVAVAQDALMLGYEAGLSKANDKLEHPLRIANHSNLARKGTRGGASEGHWSNDAAIVSASTAGQLLGERNAGLRDTILGENGLQAALNTAQAEVNTLSAMVSRSPLQEAQLAQASEQVAALTKDLGDAQAILKQGEMLSARLRAAHESIVEALQNGDDAKVHAEISKINSVLDRAYQGTLQRVDKGGNRINLTPEESRIMQRAGSLLLARYPVDHGGSNQVVKLQISQLLTSDIGGGDGFVQLSRSIQKGLSGDFDGDMVFNLSTTWLDESAYGKHRAGRYRVGAVDGGAKTDVQEVLIPGSDYDETIIREMSRHIGSSGAMGAVATSTIQDLRGDITGLIVDKGTPQFVRDALQTTLDDMETRLTDANPDTRQQLLNDLNARIGGYLGEKADSEWVDYMMVVDNFFQQHLQEFQIRFATWKPFIQADFKTKTVYDKKTGRTWVEIKDNDPARLQSQDGYKNARERAVQSSVNQGATMALLFPGDTMFRMFQKIHYSVVGANILNEANAVEQPPSLEAAAMAYRAMGQQANETQAEISGREVTEPQEYARNLVRALAKEMAEGSGGKVSASQALALVSNMAVADTYLDESGTVRSSGKIVSMSQMALREGVAHVRGRDRNVLKGDTAKQSKLAQLERVSFVTKDGKNAERAFLELWGNEPFSNLLGEEAAAFGENLTPNQFLRRYVNLDGHGRNDETHRLKMFAGYLGSRKAQSLPYMYDEVNGFPDVTQYRAVLDSMLAVGNAFEGDMASRSRQIGEQFRTGHENLHEALDQYVQSRGRTLEQITEDGSMRTILNQFLKENPPFDTLLYQLLPTDQVNASFRRNADNTVVYVANYLHDMLVERDSAKAELIFARGLLISGLNARQARVTGDNEADTDRMSMANLPRRLQRMLYRLENRGDGGVARNVFLQKLESAGSVESFENWLNDVSGLVTGEPRYAMWKDDSADYDANLGGGGWNATGPSALLNESIAAFSEGAIKLNDRAHRDARREREERQMITRLTEASRQVQAAEAAAGKPLTGEARYKAIKNSDIRNHFRSFEEQVVRTKRQGLTFGPAAMMNMLFGTIDSFYAKAHNKGQNPLNYTPLGEFEMSRDGLGYLTNPERLKAALTSANLNDIGSNLVEAMIQDLRTTTDDGQQVVWRAPDSHKLVELLANPNTREFARELLLPKTVDLNPDTGVSSEKYLFTDNIAELVKRNQYADIYGPGPQAALKYLSLLEREVSGLTTDDGQGGQTPLDVPPFTVANAVGSLVVARLQGLTSPPSPYMQAEMLSTAVMDVARALQAVGESYNKQELSKDGTGEYTLSRVSEGLKKALQKNQRNARLGVATETKEVDEALLESFLTDARTKFDQTRSENMKAGDPTTEEGREAIDAADAMVDALEKRLRQVMESTDFRQVVDMFTGASGDPAKQAVLASYVLDNPNMLMRSPSLRGSIEAIHSINKGETIYTNDDVEWDDLGDAVVAYVLDTMSTEAAPGTGMLNFRSGAADMQKYWDPTYGFLTDLFVDRESPLVQGAAKMLEYSRAFTAPQDVAENTTKELTDQILRSIYAIDDGDIPGRRLGEWTSEVPMLIVTAHERTASAPGAQLIAGTGDSSKRQSLLSASTKRRDSLIPGDEFLSTISLDPMSLTREISTMLPFQLGAGGVQAPSEMPLGMLNGRFVKNIRIVEVDSNGVETLVENLLPGDMGELGYRFLGGKAKSSPYRSITLRRLNEYSARAMQNISNSGTRNLRLSIDFLHPDSQPSAPGNLHNVLFQGVNLESVADTYESGIAALFESPGGINQLYQRIAIDSVKKAKTAVKILERTLLNVVENQEGMAGRSLSSVISMKASTLVEKDLGFGALDQTLFNAAREWIKLSHFVTVQRQDGSHTLLPADEVIRQQSEFRTTNPAGYAGLVQSGGSIPLVDPETNAPVTWLRLYIPSETTLRTMLGESGSKGSRVPLESPEYDLTRVQSFQGVSSEMLKKIPSFASEPTSLEHTPLAVRRTSSKLSVATNAEYVQAGQFRGQLIHLESAASDAAQARSELTVAPATHFAAAVKAAEMSMSKDTPLREMSIGGVVVPSPPATAAAQALAELTKHQARVQQDHPQAMGFRVRGSGPTNPQDGTISLMQLENPSSNPGRRVVYKDLAVVELSTFGSDAEAIRAVEALRHTGATIALVDASGHRERRGTLQLRMSGWGYEAMNGSSYIFEPVLHMNGTTAQKARLSTWETGTTISTQNRILTLLSTEVSVTENTAYVLEKDQQISVTSNLVRPLYLADHGLASEKAGDNSQAKRVMQRLLIMNSDPTIPDLLTDMAGGDVQQVKDTEQFTKPVMTVATAWDRLIKRIQDHGSLYEFGDDSLVLGDIIPLVSPNGNMMFYRVGFKAPSEKEMRTHWERAARDKGNPLGVSIFKSKLEASATFRTGQVKKIERSEDGTGLNIVTLQRLQDLGDKLQAEGAGMKYTTVRVEDVPQYQLPAHSFLQGIKPGIISDLASAQSKGFPLIDDYSTAFQLFGINFLPTVTEHLMPGRGQEEAAQQSVRDMLIEIQKMPDKTSAKQGLESMRLLATFEATRDRITRSAILNEEQLDLFAKATQLDPTSGESQLVAGLLTYLTIEGSTLDNALWSAGLQGEPTSDVVRHSRSLSPMFTQIFDRAKYGSPLQTLAKNLLQDRVNNPAGRAAIGKGRGGEGWILNDDLTVTSRAANGNEMTFALAYPQYFSSGDNPVLDAMAHDPNDKQGPSIHNSGVMRMATGSRVFTKKDMESVSENLLGAGVVEFEDADTSRLYQLLRSFPDSGTDKTFDAALQLTPGEVEYELKAKDRMKWYRHAIDRTGVNQAPDWTQAETARFDEKVSELLTYTGLKKDQGVMVEYWVRQFLGDANGVNSQGEVFGAHVEFQRAMEGLKQVEKNIKQGLIPTYAGIVPVLHATDLEQLFMAHTNGRGNYRLAKGAEVAQGVLDNANGTSDEAAWHQWISAAMGQVMSDKSYLFDAYFLTPTDGFYHTYKSLSRTMVNMPVSLNDLRVLSISNPKITKELALLNPEALERMVSIDPNRAKMMQDPIIFQEVARSLEDYMTGESGDVEPSKANGYRARGAMTRHRLDMINKTRREKGLPILIEQSMGDFLSNGMKLTDHSESRSAFFRTLMHMRTATSLLNLGLAVTSIVDNTIRRSVDAAVNLVSGEHTGVGGAKIASIVAKSKAKAALSHDAHLEKLRAQRVNLATETERAKLDQQIQDLKAQGPMYKSAWLGITAQRSMEQVKGLQQMYAEWGSRDDFKKLILDDTAMYKTAEGAGRVEKFFALGSQLGGRMQHMAVGSKKRKMAEVYMGAVLRYIQVSGDVNATIEQILAYGKDPTWISKNLPEAHQMGINTINQMAAVKETVYSLMLRDSYERMSHASDSSRQIAGFIGEAALKFSAFNINFLLNATGMSWTSDMVAMHLDGKKKGLLTRRIQAALSGRQLTEADGLYDMSSVLEGLDLSHSFARGAVTHTSLFMYAMMNGGLGMGFSGEDDEMRRRRRAAEFQGAVMLQNPWEIEEDFRNKDLIFLDGMWDIMDTLTAGFISGDEEEGRRVGAMPWTMKQYISPLIGIEKFVSTGDTSWIIDGFAEAVGSMPLVNWTTISEGFKVGIELAKSGEDELATDQTPAGWARGTALIAASISTMASIMFEAPFANAVYRNMSGEFEKNPFAKAMEVDGQAAYDIDGSPRADLTQAPYVDPATGEIVEGFMQEERRTGNIKSMTQNRLTMALAMTALDKAFNGGRGEYMRHEMADKVTAVAKAPISEQLALAMIMAEFEGLGGGAALSDQEAQSLVIADYKSAGRYYDMESEEFKLAIQEKQYTLRGFNVMALLNRFVADEIPKGSVEQARVASVLTGQTTLGLQEGVQKDREFFLTPEMREGLQSRVLHMLTQQGVDMGLSQKSAVYRAQRLYHGSDNGSVPGTVVGERTLALKDIMWAEKEVISFGAKNYYKHMKSSSQVKGPDGNYYSSGGRSPGWTQIMGFPLPMKMHNGETIGRGTDVDSTFNVVDQVGGLNTGLRAVRPYDPALNIPTAAERDAGIQDALDKIAAKDFSPTIEMDGVDGGRSGYRRGGGGGYRRRGGGGGGYRRSSGGGYFSFTPVYLSRANNLPDTRAARIESANLVRSGNTILRRTAIRRERFSSERGRLKQWQ